jgi:hypothetical protein
VATLPAAEHDRARPAPACASLVLAAVGGAAFVVGTALRLEQFARRRPLWLDECMLALNIASRSALELIRPLDYNQAAPPVFLWIERLAVCAGGVNEVALRSWPFAAGVILLAVLWPLGRRLGGPAVAAAAVTMAALSPTLARHADEAKPYGPDALVTAVLLLVAVWAAETGTRRRWIVLGAVGIIGIAASIPAVFVLAGLVAGLALHPRVRPDGWRPLAGCALAWALAAAALYLLYYLPVATDARQHEGYAAAFLTPGGGLGSRAGLALRGTLLPTFAGNGWVVPVVPASAVAALAVIVMGGIAVAARRGGAWAAALLGVPILAAVAASALRRYPLGVPRMMVFASPLLVLLVALLLAAIAEAVPARWRTAMASGLVVAVAAPMGGAALWRLREPWRGEDAPALVAAFRERPKGNEPIYVGARAMPSWLFYTTNWQAPNRERLAFYARAAASDGPSFENGPPRLHYVYEEGGLLVYQHRDRREILGLFSGRQWRWPGYVGEADPGWAENEAARIVREANPCAWLYFTHTSDNTARPILWQLRDRHQGRRAFQLVVAGGVLFRYCFPYKPEHLEDLRRWSEDLQAARSKADRAAPE